MTIPRISGADMLRAVKNAPKQNGDGYSLRISLFDSYDLFKLDEKQLVDEFDFEVSIAQKVVAALNHADLSELSQAIGVTLIVDKTLKNSLIPNAGIIRSAGAWADNASVPTTADEIVDDIRRMRTPQPKS
jgi:hypothetical protein